MHKQAQVLEMVLNNFGRIDKDLFKQSKLPDENFNEELKALELSDFKKRSNFQWEVQAELEKNVKEHAGMNIEEILIETAKSWNEKKKIKITTQMLKKFLDKNIHLKFPNSLKAFVYICEGNLESHKAFTKNHTIFFELFMRLIISHTNDHKNVIKMAEELLPRLYKEESSLTKYLDTLNRLAFFKQAKPSFGKMGAYRRVVGSKGLAFDEGMHSIILSVLKDEGESEEVLAFMDSLKSRISIMIEDVQTDDESEAENIEEYVKNKTGVETIQPKKVELVSEFKGNRLQEHTIIPEKVEQPAEQTKILNEVVQEQDVKEEHVRNKVLENIGNQTNDQQQKDKDSRNKDVKNVNNDETISNEKDAITDLEKSLINAQTALKRLKKESIIALSNKKENEIEMRLKIAEEENARLKTTLLQKKEKMNQIEEKVYTDILEAIGGKTSNYLLSDLYEESQGNQPENRALSAGRLVNLFSNLSLSIGLEEYTGTTYYELGEVFEIHKSELIKNYMIEGPIASSNDLIKVQLLKYGWAINSIAVINPLVKEIKEEE